MSRPNIKGNSDAVDRQKTLECSEIVINVLATCKQAMFVFEKEIGFALYLDFEFYSDLPTKTGCSFYLTDMIKVRNIMAMLNKKKTGIARHSIQQSDLKKLIGMQTNIVVDQKEICTFKGFDVKAFHHRGIKN